MTDAKPSGRRSVGDALRKLLRQPLTQFLCIGAAIFVVARWTDSAEDGAAHTIVVDRDRAERLAELYRVQMGSAPSPADLEFLIDSYVRDEMLYREAVKMGLDRDDEIIRRRLIQKMEFLQHDLAAVSEPSEDELRRYHAEHAAMFTVRATTTFGHLYFSADSVGDEQARLAAERQLAALGSSDGEINPSLGDPFPLQHSYAELTEQDAAQIFGRTPFVEAIFSQPQQQWRGPVRSGYGWHLIFVSKRVPPRSLAFSESRDRVREAYLAEQKRAANDRADAALSSRYKILRLLGENRE